MRWINLCLAHEKTLDPFSCCLLRPLPSLPAPDYDWLWTNSDQQTKHENPMRKKGRLRVHTLIGIHTQSPLSLFIKTWICFYQDLKDAWLPSIITTQRNAFVRWIINKSPSSLHLQFNYTYNQRRCGSQTTKAVSQVRWTPQPPPALQFHIKATSPFDE